jgi:hypothetical protein
VAVISELKVASAQDKGLGDSAIILDILKLEIVLAANHTLVGGLGAIESAHVLAKTVHAARNFRRRSSLVPMPVPVSLMWATRGC